MAGARRISIAALVSQPDESPRRTTTTTLSEPAATSPTASGVQTASFAANSAAKERSPPALSRPVHNGLSGPSVSAPSSAPASTLPYTTQPLTGHQDRAISPTNPQSASRTLQHARSAHFAPYPQRIQHRGSIEYETQFSPSNRKDIPPSNNPISFEFYDPSEPKKPSKSRTITRTGQRSTEFVFEAGSSSGNKTKREKPSKPKARTGGPRKKSSRDSHTSEISTISSTLEDAANAMSDHLKPTAESQNENSQSWSEPPGQAYVPADSTVDDDILADLDMAESQNLDANTATRLSSPYPSDRMDLDFPSPSPIPTHPAPSKTPSSMATPSPAPSAIIPSTTSNPKKKSASKSTAKASQSGNASKASTSAKAKGSTAKTAGGKNKNDLLKPSAAGSVRGKKSDSDVAWTGTSSGRAAAAAATAALGNFEYGDDLDTRSPAAGATSGTAKAAWDEEDDEEVDRRLYCVCRELYDDRFMLGCDGCDEWFHPPCLGMEDFQCDLLEHFYCASCCKSNPSLKTTWRVRCANGLTYPYPNTAEACWRAALPPLSKYCSKECGVEAMERKIMPWIRSKARVHPDSTERTPAMKEELQKLWRGVKDARRRDAVVLQLDADGRTIKTDVEQSLPNSGVSIQSARKDASHDFGRLNVEFTALREEYESISREAQIRTRELSFILARGRLAKLAVQWSEKPDNLSRCCFDSRLLMEGNEWEEWVQGVGKAVLEGGMTAPTKGSGPGSANATGEKVAASEPGENQGDEKPEGAPEEEEFGMDAADSPWCDGRRKCERHFGWQKLGLAEFELNKGTKEMAIQKLSQIAMELSSRLEQTRQLLDTTHTPDVKSESTNTIVP